MDLSNSIPSRLIYIRRIMIELSKKLNRKPTKQEIKEFITKDIELFLSEKDTIALLF